MDKSNCEYNLTIQQKNIWFIERLYENTNINNITGIFTIKQLLDLSVMEQVMNKMIENNEAFRLRIKEDKGNPLQYLANYEYEKIPIFVVKTKKEVEKIINTIKLEKFNFLNSKLYYIAIIQDSNTTYVCVKMHHIISDAWTL